MKTFEEKKKELDYVWNNIVKHMSENGYVEMGSCNKDYSRYLVLDGTQKEVSYQGKPKNSLRISDHWNWKNERKAPGKIQCAIKHVREPKEGERPLRRIGIYFYKDDSYEWVCGEFFKHGQIMWIVPNMTDIFKKIDSMMEE